MKHPKAVLTVVGLTLGATVAFYTYTTYLQKFMVNTVGLPKGFISRINFVSLLIFGVLQPIAELLSDKIGRRSLLMTFDILGTLLTAPIFFMEKTTESIVAFLLMMVGLIIVTGYTSINAIVKAELFPLKFAYPA
ncbi:hypothetical protein BCM0074_0868 [Bacillus cereus]|nr:hypothetical protein BCM0074_0868 [Bacillus cereus]